MIRRLRDRHRLLVRVAFLLAAVALVVGFRAASRREASRTEAGLGALPDRSHQPAGED